MWVYNRRVVVYLTTVWCRQKQIKCTFQSFGYKMQVSVQVGNSTHSHLHYKRQFLLLPLHSKIENRADWIHLRISRIGWTYSFIQVLLLSVVYYNLQFSYRKVTKWTTSNESNYKFLNIQSDYHFTTVWDITPSFLEGWNKLQQLMRKCRLHNSLSTFLTK